MDEWDQLYFFPTATVNEIKQAKSLLSKFRRLKMLVDDFEKQDNVELSSKQKEKLDKFRSDLKIVQRAVNLITDNEVKRIIEFRFIKGERHKITVAHFYGSMHPTTIDRKINKGIESVANTLKIWDE